MGQIWDTLNNSNYSVVTMASITKRGDKQWQAKIRRKGSPGISKTFETKARAERWARQVESEIDEGSFIPRGEAEDTTLAEALQRYQKEITPHKKGAIQESNRIDLWIKHPLSTKFLPNIRGSDMAAYRDSRVSDGKAPSTINNELNIISHLYNIAKKEWGMECLLNPIDNIRKVKPRPGRNRRLVGDEEERLLLHAKSPLKEIIIIAIETGMREGEILSLSWENIALEARTAWLPDTKPGESRLVPLSTRVKTLFQNSSNDVSGAIFPNLTGSAVSHQFLALTRELEIDDLKFHDLRHEAVSRFFELGLDTMEVSAISGHKTLTMLKRYTHLKAEDLAKKLP